MLGGGEVLQISLLFLIKVPIYLAGLLVANIVNIIAPGLVLSMVKKKMLKSNDLTDDSAGNGNKFKWGNIESSADVAFFVSLDLVRQKTMARLRDILKEAQVGGAAPNPELIDLDTKAKLPLLSLARAGRPLVINFGSCTWPPFMANLGKFGELRQNFSEVADFVTIYIAEAHPAERGHFRVGGDDGNYDIDTHINIADRLNAAETLQREAGEALKGCKILVDPMDDRANNAYASLPERLYVVQDGQVAYQGGLGPFDYRIGDVENFLKKTK